MDGTELQNRIVHLTHKIGLALDAASTYTYYSEGLGPSGKPNPGKAIYARDEVCKALYEAGRAAALLRREALSL